MAVGSPLFAGQRSEVGSALCAADHYLLVGHLFRHLQNMVAGMLHPNLRLTHNSFATIIAWLSTCLLASGFSTFLNENVRALWLWWGLFGLVAAVGLEAVAMMREQRHLEHLNKVAVDRFERELQMTAAEHKASTAVHRAVARLCVEASPSSDASAGPRGAIRHSCDFNASIISPEDGSDAVGGSDSLNTTARLTNISADGFELTLDRHAAPQKIAMSIDLSAGDQIHLMGEILWCSPKPNGLVIAGGRLLEVLPEEPVSSLSNEFEQVSSPADLFVNS